MVVLYRADAPRIPLISLVGLIVAIGAHRYRWPWPKWGFAVAVDWLEFDWSRATE